MPRRRPPPPTTRRAQGSQGSLDACLARTLATPSEDERRLARGVEEPGQLVVQTQQRHRCTGHLERGGVLAHPGPRHGDPGGAKDLADRLEEYVELQIGRASCRERV